MISTGGATVTDPVFGEMKYIFGWVKTMQGVFGGTGFSFLCVAEAKPWEDILPAQQKSYKRFIKNEKGTIKRINRALTVLLNSPDGPKIVPRELIFTRDGGAKFIFDALWDTKKQICLTIYPKMKCEETEYSYLN